MAEKGAVFLPMNLRELYTDKLAACMYLKLTREQLKKTHEDQKYRETLLKNAGRIACERLKLAPAGHRAVLFRYHRGTALGEAILTDLKTRRNLGHDIEYSIVDLTGEENHANQGAAMGFCYIMGVVTDERIHLPIVTELRLTLDQFLRLTADPDFYRTVLRLYGKKVVALYGLDSKRCTVDILEAGSGLHASYMEVLEEIGQSDTQKKNAIDLTEEAPL